MDRYVIQLPDPRLHAAALPVPDSQTALRVAEKLADVAYLIRSTIYKYPRGFEIAAPQIGEPYCLIMLQGEFSHAIGETNTTVLVNPEILEESDFVFNWEDCFSAKEMRGCVERCGRIRVRYLDLHWQVHDRVFLGTEAADVQHGIDHLQGTTFFTRSMKYFIPVSIYRPLKDKGVDVLNEYVAGHYRLFDPEQFLTAEGMKQYGCTHPRQCLPLS
jgi:peptide deformylase